jgi:hypothetical protein
MLFSHLIGWGQTLVNWNTNNIATGTAFTPTSSPNVSVTINGSNFQSSTPKYNVANGSGSWNYTGLGLAADWPNTSSSITVTITITNPDCAYLTIPFYDINGDTGVPFEDKVVVQGYTEDNVTPITVNSTNYSWSNSSFCNGSLYLGGNPTVQNSVIGRCSNGAYNANSYGSINSVVNLTLKSQTSKIGKVVITYKESTTSNDINAFYSGTNPGVQNIVIGNITSTSLVTTVSAPTSITGTTTICSGSSTTLTAMGGSASSQWFTGSCGGTSIGTGASITVSPTTTTTYFVRNFTSPCGFSSCVSTTVNVNSPPSAVSAGSNSPICEGSSLNLTGTATGITSWSWLGPNNFSSSVQSPIITNATSAASGTYFLTAQNSCGTGTGLFDDFSDNNFTSNPVWTPQPNPSTGVTPTTWTSGVLNLTGANGNSEEVISTPSNQVFGSWKFDFKMGQINHANAIVSFIFISNQSTLINAQGYYISIRGNPSTNTSTIYLRRYNGAINQGGNANNVTLASYTWSGDTNPHSLMVTRGTNGVFSIYFDNVLLGVTSPDLTYTTSSFAGFFHYSSNLAINHEVDNIVCSSTLVDVTVNPSVATPIFALGTVSTRCIAAGTVTYTATSTNATGITYSIDATSTAGGVTINFATGDVTYPLAWSGITVITASATGCGGPLTANHTVTTTPNIDFANLQSPLSGQMCASGVFDVFGQVFINGVTNSAGVTSGLIAELGISSTNSNPSGAGWTWINAPFNIQVGNNDEFKGTFSGLSAGTYYYAFRYSYNGCSFVYGGSTGIWSNTADNGILTVYSAPSLTVNPSTICNDATNIAVAGSGASTYELLLNGVSRGDASSTSSWTVAGPLSTGNTVCVRGYPANNLVMNGNISESFWGVPIVNSNGGPGSGFSPNRLNAIYIRNGFGFLNLAVAGRLDHDNKILIFLDTKTGIGFNNLSGWTNRSNAPHNAIRNLKGDVGSSIQFDAGFFADYIVSVGVDNNGIHYLDLYDMVTNTNTFIGNNSANSNRISYQANASATDFSQGYELRIPMNLLGTLSNPMQVFAMLTNNPASGSATFLSNQFLTRANNSQGNFGDGAINFNNEPPNPISYGLYPECFTDLCRTIAAIVTPNFTPVAAICAGGTLAALPTTSTNGITGTWAPALDNTQTTTYTFTPTSGLCASSTTMTITVNPLPSVIANSNSPFCAGQAINLTATDGFSAYAWSGPNSFSNATQNPSISNAQAINAGTYTVTVTDGNGCQTTSSTVVSLTTSPTAGSNSPVCVGGELTLSTNSATSYSWSGPNSFTSSVQNPTVSASATTSMAGMYTVSVIGSCASTTGVLDNFSDGNFTANPVWTVRAGDWVVSFNELLGNATAINDRITTPSIQAYGTWEFQFELDLTTYGIQSQVRFFILSSGADLTNTNGYYFYADAAGNLKLIRRTGGSVFDLISTTYVVNTNMRSVRITRDFNGLFTLSLGGIIMGSATDNTYTSSNNIGIWTTGFDPGDNPIIDNISCSPPSTAQTTVVINQPPSIISISPP